MEKKKQRLNTKTNKMEYQALCEKHPNEQTLRFPIIYQGEEENRSTLLTVWSTVSLCKVFMLSSMHQCVSQTCMRCVGWQTVYQSTIHYT